MKITGAKDTEFPDDVRLPFDASHRLKAADGSIVIGTDNYVDESCEIYIVSGHRNSVGAGCHNISILNSRLFRCIAPGARKLNTALNSSPLNV